jgi:hypothetical protein
LAYIGKTPTAVPIGTNDLADNIVTVSKLASTLDLSSNTITLPSGVGGKVLQVVQTDGTEKIFYYNIFTLFMRHWFKCKYNSNINFK